MEAVESRELQARDYLEKHRIMELLNHLTSVLLFARPPKPREYLMSVLERLRIAKATGVPFPFFMDNSNIMSMFDMMDPSGKGTISFAQYKEALKNLGLCTADEVLNDDGHIITLDKFRDEVGKHSAVPQMFHPEGKGGHPEWNYEVFQTEEHLGTQGLGNYGRHFSNTMNPS